MAKNMNEREKNLAIELEKLKELKLRLKKCEEIELDLTFSKKWLVEKIFGIYDYSFEN